MREAHKLKDRESSKWGTVRFAQTRREFVRMANELASEPNRKAKYAAIYTSHQDSALGRLDTGRVAARLLFDITKDLSPDTVTTPPLSVTEFQERVHEYRSTLSVNRNILYQNGNAVASYDAAINILNAIERDVTDMMQGFGDWMIHTIRYRYDTGAGGDGFDTRITSPGWHEDFEVRGKKPTLVLIKTVLGPSTVFSPLSTSNPDKNESKKIAPPDASLTAHLAGFTQHRSPLKAETPGARSALVIKIARE